MATILYIKNMVCNRCIMVVESILKAEQLTAERVELGMASIRETLTEEQKESVRRQLEAVGFELMDDKRSLLIEHIKQLIIELIHRQNGELRTNLSDYLTEHCGQDYSALSKLFSEINGITIEKYFIAQKIERVKELLAYDELSLNEIADLLNYSSTAHLSAQFKSVTGMPPSQFKKQASHKRLSLDKIGQ